MINIDEIKVYGWEAAIRGMRNPMNSWDRGDSVTCLCEVNAFAECEMVLAGHCPAADCNNGEVGFCVGENDHDLMKRLCKAGTEHRKFMRMITVTMDVTAPLYWWKEFDTYKVGTVANSCSTMHKISAKRFELADFSFEHMGTETLMVMDTVITRLNFARDEYILSDDKEDWWQMIQLLPSSYNQRRTVLVNYEVLANVYRQRKSHKLDEWREFCKAIEKMPYSELMMGGADE